MHALAYKKLPNFYKNLKKIFNKETSKEHKAVMEFLNDFQINPEAFCYTYQKILTERKEPIKIDWDKAYDLFKDNEHNSPVNLSTLVVILHRDDTHIPYVYFNNKQCYPQHDAYQIKDKLFFGDMIDNNFYHEITMHYSIQILKEKMKVKRYDFNNILKYENIQPSYSHYMIDTNPFHKIHELECYAKTLSIICHRLYNPINALNNAHSELSWFVEFFKELRAIHFEIKHYEWREEPLTKEQKIIHNLFNKYSKLYYHIIAYLQK